MVTPRQLQEALNHQQKSGGKLGKVFVSLNFVKDEEIAGLLSRHYGVPSINLDHFEVGPARRRPKRRSTMRSTATTGRRACLELRCNAAIPEACDSRGHERIRLVTTLKEVPGETLPPRSYA